MSANLPFLLPHSPPDPFREDHKEPLWTSLACDLGHVVVAGKIWPETHSFSTPPLGGQ